LSKCYNVYVILQLVFELRYNKYILSNSTKWSTVNFNFFHFGYDGKNNDEYCTDYGY